MGPTVRVKRGDTAPLLRFRCLDDVTPLDLTGATVRLIMTGTEGPPVIDATMTPDPQGTDTGWVHYQWQAGDTDTPGQYRAELEVTWPDGAVQTFPQDDYIRVTIIPDLG